MKTLLITLFLSMVPFASDASNETDEKASIDWDHQIRLEFTAKHIPAKTRKQTFGICIYENQLWECAMTDPPEKILTNGTITIEGQTIELDVRGLATPWIKPNELTKENCNLTKHDFDEQGYYYNLKVAFIKGGALDYMVTWIIYKNKSLRVKIESLDDIRLDWMKK